MCGLAVSGDPLCYSLALRAAGGRHWLPREVDKSGMAPQGPWVARGEAALGCQSLSPEVPEPRGDTSWPGRALELSAAAATSPALATPGSEQGPAVHLAPVRHTAGEPESVQQHEHAYTCLQPCRDRQLPHTACSGQGAS